MARTKETKPLPLDAQRRERVNPNTGLVELLPSLVSVCNLTGTVLSV